MNENENNVIDITKEFRKSQRKAWIREKLIKAKEFWDDNKQYAVIVVPAVGALIGKGIQAASKHRAFHMEERIKDCRCYDPSLGHYWELKRKLSNDDWVKINRRKNRGEALGDILDEMDLLK